MKRTFMLLAMMMISFFSNSQIINIPDPNFRNALLKSNCVDTNGDYYGDIDADLNNDNVIDMSEVMAVKGLIVNNKSIDSLDGINFFQNLEILECKNNRLTKVVLENFTKLHAINLSNNKINQLNLSALPSLNDLRLEQVEITNLSLSNFPELKSIYCDYGKLLELSLSNLPSLYRLSCFQNQLTKLTFNELPALEELACNGNNLSELSLNDYPLLSNLNCYSNQLVSLTLNKLPSLTSISCHSNKLTELSIPDSPLLETLYCGNNPLSQLTLKDFPSLKYLTCALCQFTELSISNLPLLTEISCGNNPITELNLSNLPSLTKLECYDGQLAQLSINELENLQELGVINNPLKILYAKFGKAKTLTFKLGLPSLDYICTDDVNSTFFKSKFPNAIINSYCSFTPGGKFYNILGEINLDVNNSNCIVNPVNSPNQKFKISPSNPFSAQTSNNKGKYSIPVLEGTYSIKPILENPEYYNVTPDSITVTFPSTFDTVIQDFCITPKTLHRQVDLSIIPETFARPGFDAKYKVVMTNKGNQVENGTLYFAYDEPKMDFVSTDVTPSTQSNGLLSWNFTDLLPFETRYYNVTLNVNSPSETPPVNAGDELLITCNILDNVFLLKQEVVGSYDPNDKTCLEGKTITPEQVGEYVHYLIRFENTGNYAAENVVVKDVIDASTFDISTLQITDASHEAWARINDNIVEFIFENIQLPFDDASNDGYICFKIKTKPTLVLGNELKNEANIYFDYNLPILTNKTNTVVAIPVGTDESVGESDIEIFPNPLNDILKCSGDDKIFKVEIFDISGNLVQVSNEVDGEVNVERLLSGAYLVKLFNASGIINKRFTKM